MSTDFHWQGSWNLDQLPSLQQAAQDWGHALAWDELQLHQVQLILEELVVNTMTHGAQALVGNEQAGWVKVECSEHEGVIKLLVMDNAPPFDPLSLPDPNTDIGLDERGNGGLGIFLARQMSDGLSHEYRDGRNIVTVLKHRGPKP